MQNEAHMGGIDDHDLFYFLMQQCRFRALKAEHHVLRGERIAVMKFQSWA